MAKVSLRLYNRDIESMIDRAQLDEAIAHCHHILKTFPKHLETYRLLGKAYLEYKRHPEAVDIFTRALTAEPNDFIANVGMSLIRDEEGKLDDAIWHMERAFEVQSANPAIQGELQRLYARRDGMAPPRIRMTRGALAHMYMRGELYPQAISEARSVLKDDAGRNDMQVLLALAFYRSGQKNEAADMATSVLRRYQYCLDANRVMVEILGIDRPESVQAYRQAVIELDPYAAQVNGTIFQTAEVGDNAVTLDRLDWNGQPIGRQVDWNSRAIMADSGFGSSPAPALATPTPSNEQPDWLKAAGGFTESKPTPPPPPKPMPATPSPTPAASFDIPASTPAPAVPTPATSAAPADDSIPDFLRAAGWGTSTGEFDESKSSFADEPVSAPASAAEPVQGDLPDWVKAMMPAQVVEPPADQAQPAQEEEIPDWIKNMDTGALKAAAVQPMDSQTDWLQPEESAPAQPIAEEQPDWMRSFGDPETSSQPASNDMPDWMSGLPAAESSTSSAASGDSLDWLSGLDQPETTSAQPAQSTQPDWMSGFSEPEPAPQAPAASDSLDWLSGLDQPESTSAQPAQSAQPDWLQFGEPASEAPASANDDFDFLNELTSSAPASTPEPTPAPASNQNLGQQDIDDSLAWLENLAAKQGATEGLLIKPEDRKDKEPDWLSQTKSAPAEPPAAPAPTPVPAPVSNQNLGQQDIDDSLAWLENLAAKQGATEGLLIKPEDRKDKEPDWLSQTKSTPIEPPAVPAPTPAPTPAPASNQNLGQQDIDDSLAWLENLAAKQGATEGLLIKPEDRKDKEPDWLSQTKSTPIEPPAVPAPTPAPTPAPASNQNLGQQDIDDSLAWLENLAAKQGATEGLLIKPEDRKEKEPDWLSQTKSAPAEPPVAPAPTPAPTSTPASNQNLGQQDIDDSLAWLENLAAKQGATEGLLIKPEDRMDKEPDWVTQAKSAPAEPPVAPAPTPAPTSTPASNQNLGQQDIDDSLAWLENLAAKQGATEGLLVKPEDRKDKEPDWVTQAKSAPVEPVPTETESFDQPQAQPADDVPAWLRGMEQEDEATPVIAEDATAMWLKTLDEPEAVEPQQTEPADDLPAWLQGIADEEQAPVAESNVPVEEAVGESNWLDAIEDHPSSPPPVADQPIPSWLKGMEEESPRIASGSQGDLPAWMRDETGEVVAEPTKIEPTRASDWTPAVEQKPVAPEPPAPQPQVVKETPPPVVEAPLVSAQDKPEPKPVKKAPAKTEIAPATPPPPYREPVTMRGTGMLSMPVDPMLGSARNELSRSNIPSALEAYGKLIKKGRFLDETIFDLREALYRYPVEVSIWQTLGDAYMRANRLQDALDAYTKAEELLR